MCQVVEDLALLLSCDGAVLGELYHLITSLRAMGHGDLSDGGVVVLVVTEVVRHIGDAPQVALDLAGRTPLRQVSQGDVAGRRERPLGGKASLLLLLLLMMMEGAVRRGERSHAE